MTLTGTNQLWVADITYIRLQREFVYLAVILDAFGADILRYTTPKVKVGLKAAVCQFTLTRSH